MKAMRLFIDTHDRSKGTFPPSLSADQFHDFYAAYLKACAAEGVINLEVDVGLGEGRAFCMNLAADADSIRRVHDRVGLPFDSVTEVRTANPGALFFQPEAA